MRLEPQIESAEGQRILAEFTASYDEFATAAAEAVRLSRQETIDGVEERDGSRTLYTGTVLEVLEGLDVFHDQLEDVIAEQAQRAGRGGRRHGGVGQAPAADRARRGAAVRRCRWRSS